MDFINTTLHELESKGLLRKITVIDKIKYPYVYINDKKYLLFSSNDYLGLANHPKLKKAAVEAIKKYGTGSTASRLTSGTYGLHKELEEKVAKFKKSEAALVFPSGYQTNIAVISALAERNDLVILDKFNHASIIDGARLSGADIRIYPHKNIDYLERILKTSRSYKKKLIITESIFSMDGDMAPLKEIAGISKKYNAVLMVDEAHATGVFGKNGGGLIEELNLHNEIDIKMGTFSKALGSQGGFIAGPKKLVNFIINKGRGFIYSTALSPIITASNLMSVNMAEERKVLRQKLWQNVNYLKKSLSKLGINYLNSESQIFPLIIGDVEETIKASKYFFSCGIFTPAIRYPTVPKKEGRIRISVCAFQREQDIDRIIKVISAYKSNSGKVV